MKNTMKKITTFIYRGREFYILESEPKMICGKPNKYWGIESKYFDETGHLTQEINGCAGHLSETVKECLTKVKDTIEVDYIEETTGCTKMEAIEKYYMALMQEAK